MPQLVFPFVKLFASSPASSQLPPEACFEMTATLLCNWAKGWFDRFPHPPVGVLVRLTVSSPAAIATDVLTLGTGTDLSSSAVSPPHSFCAKLLRQIAPQSSAYNAEL